MWGGPGAGGQKNEGTVVGIKMKSRIPSLEAVASAASYEELRALILDGHDRWMRGWA